MKNKKKFFKLVSIMVFFLLIIACKKENKSISVISREDGSGTRGAFIELFKIEEKNTNGEKIDNTTADAVVTNSTAIMLTTVSGDKNAIGYVSFGSLNNTVKALKIDGVKPTTDEIKSGNYKISRPFNIVTKANISPVAQDFINYILSDEGKNVIEKAGYISVDNLKPYKSQVTSGKITISGSSSVTPVMEKLKEAYITKNPGIVIEIQQSDSSTGVTNAIDRTADIGMASRELKETEKQKGVDSKVIAIDGIAIIVNKENTINNLTSEDIKKIFTGNENSWKKFVN